MLKSRHVLESRCLQSAAAARQAMQKALADVFYASYSQVHQQVSASGGWWRGEGELEAGVEAA